MKIRKRLHLLKFQVHSCLYSYIPFVVLLITNGILIYSITHRRVRGVENEPSRRRQRSMNRTVFLATFLFIVMTLPSTIAGNMLNWLVKIPRGLQIVVILNTFSLTYHAHGLVILFVTNRKFRQVFKQTFFNYKTRLQSMIGSLNDKFSLTL